MDNLRDWLLILFPFMSFQRFLGCKGHCGRGEERRVFGNLKSIRTLLLILPYGN